MLGWFFVATRVVPEQTLVKLKNGQVLTGKNVVVRKEIYTQRESEKFIKKEAVVVIKPNDESLLPKKVSISMRTGTGKSLTSTLSAKSKAACRISKKLVQAIVDIDATDVNNELAVVEYVKEMYQLYNLSENEYRVHDFMGALPDINSKMRDILVDWLIEVYRKFELMLESLLSFDQYRGSISIVESCAKEGT